jgi:hypothetical protein
MTVKNKAVLVMIVVAALLLSAAVEKAAQRQPPRLLVRNATGTVIELAQRSGNRWESRGRVYAGSSLPIVNVSNGDQFRAQWPGGNETHVVKLVYDRSYGGYQDVWSVPTKQ